MAIHTPLAQDNLDQPHSHLMFSERAVTEATRAMPEERFFNRNGAKKDPAWIATPAPVPDAKPAGKPGKAHPSR